MINDERTHKEEECASGSENLFAVSFDVQSKKGIKMKNSQSYKEPSHCLRVESAHDYVLDVDSSMMAGM